MGLRGGANNILKSRLFEEFSSPVSKETEKGRVRDEVEEVP